MMSLLCFLGGHGYEILEDNTKVLEIKKMDLYLGAEIDRDRLNLDG